MKTHPHKLDYQAETLQLTSPGSQPSGETGVQKAKEVVHSFDPFCKYTSSII